MDAYSGSGAYEQAPPLRAKAELRSGERLLWAGVPDPQRYAWEAGRAAVIVSIPWLAFILVWEGIVISAEGGPEAWLMALFGSPFILVGLWMLTQPFWLKRQARHVVYAITTERAVIVERGKVRSFALDEIEETERRDRADGSGTLYFAKELVRSRKGRVRTQKVGFIAIPQVRQVDAILDRARRGDTFVDMGPARAPETSGRSIIPAAG